MEQLKLDNCLSKVVGESTPGIPLMKLGRDNASVLEHYSGEVKQMVVTSFLNAILLGEQVFDLNAKELIVTGVRDPIRLFIKNEPHNRRKLNSGKLRLISGVSLRDQLKERILGALQNNAEIAAWTTCPSRPGIGLNDEGLLIMADIFRKELEIGPIMETDVSGWDWSVQSWELEADSERRRRLAQAKKGSLFDFLLRVQARCTARSVYVLPGGEMVEQLTDGIQNSGSYWTSSTNSAMRNLATQVGRIRAGEKPHVDGKTGVSAMGDDSTERYWENAGKYLEELGHRVKFVKTNTMLKGISFCSHEWTEQGFASPETAIKTVYRFLSHPQTSDDYIDWFSQLAWVLRHHPDRSRLLNTCYRRVESSISASRVLSKL